MAIEQYFQDVAQNDFIKEDESSVENWKSASAAVTGSDNNPSGGFDCNICLDFVHDPVVTLCGHLFCWPCIYKWLHFQSISSENPEEQQQQQCPVCKAEVSHTTLVPLYGRGEQTTKPPSDGKAPNLGLVIPRRPPAPACGFDMLLTTPTSTLPAQQLHHRNYPHQSQPYYLQPGDYPASPMLSIGGTTTNIFNPMIGMISEMVYARVFGNSVTNLYNYPNSYHLAGSSSPRVRRHVMQADKSLSRICFFLFCCIFLCLVLF